jgi:hypothetical protein
MKPAYWIALLALVYTIFRLTGWLDATAGTVAGIIAGALLSAAWQSRRASRGFGS